MAIIGVAGTTETGNIRFPSNDMADLAQEINCHFHVDAAWGGATLLSNTHRLPLLNGIERLQTQSTIDAPQTNVCPDGRRFGSCLKIPAATDAIEHHAEYILRKGSKDLGQPHP